MDGYHATTSFDREASLRYDVQDTRGDEKQTVEFLTTLAADGPALEFAIGTGRIALPLSQRGVRVDGIELSEHMIERLREKTDSEAITVTLGDMSRVTTGRTYRLVYLVYNTIGNLISQDEQVHCFENAARHLDPYGVFVVECRVPAPDRRAGYQYVEAERVAVDHVQLDVGRYDPVTQILDESHVRIGSGGILVNPIRMRLTPPAELDLMARLAGLRLQSRWGGWSGELFTAASWRHVSVYESPGAQLEGPQ
jgi:SAM-dependent methyltransferase